MPDGRYLNRGPRLPQGQALPDVPLDRADSLKGAFSVLKSKIIREVKGDTNIEIDVSKPGG